VGTRTRRRRWLYRWYTWRRGNPHRGTSAPRPARARRAEQWADNWTKGGAAGRHVREQYVACADFKGLGKEQGALGRCAWGADAEAGAVRDVAARHVVVDGEIPST
jgi:hypothetical protein